MTALPTSPEVSPTLPATDRRPVRTWLVSVSDKTGLAELVRGIEAAGQSVTFLSTGGTFRTLAGLLSPEGPVELVAVEDYTGYPEMPGGLVKTLHPRVHGGLLADLGSAEQVAYLERHGIRPIDAVIVNLYPFEATLARPDCTAEEARQQIDIGGPTMLRAAAKNHPRVAVVTDPADYPDLLEELRTHEGTLGSQTRWRLAARAFRHVAAYDEAIARYFERQVPSADVP
jgi:phosphoribosylaminoimidazolecarboxamide formyltransferase/IMP cyclohydrolase